ncbi:GyrI-like domain-containing protein [Paenibacillus taiwanensis]|uniref:GyrI-like domain-containing protein n=1 Tax=Paenibacillus taiwanensis TaxID=401638 RepID=UPI00040680BC|nr:effector binding domain-containing protein [Paenibacillus taiwanensis]
MEPIIVERQELKLIVLHAEQSGVDVRRAWSEIQQQLEIHEVNWVNRSMGYVIVPEWQWASGVKELWVGVETHSFEHIPERLDTKIIPAGMYMKVRCTGDRNHMMSIYASIDRWIREHEYERLSGHGSYSVEANRLQPVNPFHIPADVIEQFDYDIYVPVKSLHE